MKPGRLVRVAQRLAAVLGEGSALAGGLAVAAWGEIRATRDVDFVTVRPLVEVVRPIPPLAWIPIAIVWFGIGVKSAAFIIFLGAFFPILLNTISGVTSINPILVEAARTLHAKEKHIFLKVLFPGAVPSIFVPGRSC